MKGRLFSNWTFARVFYFVMGIWILLVSVITGQWFGVLPGGYFASMGLFAFGCAAGNCSNLNYKGNAHVSQAEEITCEEIK